MKLRTGVAIAVGGLITFATTHAAHGGGADWGIFYPLSLPGVLVAAPAAFFAPQGDPREANLVVVDIVDFVFYSGLFFWVLNRWGVTRE